MIRHRFLTAGLLVILWISGREARAQWGYGGWGWSGWGATTPAGSALQGAGQYAMGAGVYNLDTAQARSINADTAMRWNQYAYESSLEASRRYAARKQAETQKNDALYDAHQKRLRENPEQREIENGDALNAAVSDLNDPRLGSSAVRAANDPVPASVIAQVPFVYASERVTIMLDRIRESIKWPEAFSGEQFAKAQGKFDDLRARLRKESEDGEVSPKALQDAKRFVSDLRAKVDTEPLKSSVHHTDAVTFVTACESVLDLLEKPNIGPALLELRKVTDTTIGNLLGFMHTFNLRFGPAKTPKQRQAYQNLYGILDHTRRTVLAEAKLESSHPGRAKSTDATNFFQSINQRTSRDGLTPRAPEAKQ
jgi:hypothetical protein